LLSAREAIDGMIGSESDTAVIGILSEARKRVDEVLAESVPGIKDVDARFEELARQSGALGKPGSQDVAGRDFLGTGPQAPTPKMVDRFMEEGVVPAVTFIGPSGESFRFTQSLRAEIDRLIGNNANDRAALGRLIKG